MRRSPEKRTRAPLRLGCRPSPASMMPALTSSSLYLPIAARSSSLAILPASESLLAFTMIMNRMFASVGWTGRRTLAWRRALGAIRLLLIRGGGELAQDVRRLGDAHQHVVDAELRQAIARRADAVLARPQPDGDRHIGQLAPQASRQIAGVVRRVWRHGGDEHAGAAALCGGMRDFRGERRRAHHTRLRGRKELRRRERRDMVGVVVRGDDAQGPGRIRRRRRLERLDDTLHVLVDEALARRLERAFAAVDFGEPQRWNDDLVEGPRRALHPRMVLDHL